jgi:hypothetical protein
LEESESTLEERNPEKDKRESRRGVEGIQERRRRESRRGGEGILERRRVIPESWRIKCFTYAREGSIC